jgi:2-methylcitrate dehydratase
VRENYIGKFNMLTEGVLAPAEAARFLEVAQRLPELSAEALAGLTVMVTPLEIGAAGLF